MSSISKRVRRRLGIGQRDEFDRVRRRLEEVKAAAARKRRRVLEPAVLEAVLPARLAARARRSTAGEAVARHAAMRAASESYAAAVDAASAPAEAAAAFEVGGLRFWVPLSERLPERLERAERQGLPLRAIAQSRELAVGRVMLDLGANIGRTSVPRAALGDFEAVYAAEPDPDNYRCLVRSVVDNGLTGFVLPDQVAIGAENGTCRLHRTRFIGGHHVVGAGEEHPETELVTVPCRTVDAWIVDLGIEIDDVAFVKVDTQGWEANVLQGAERLRAAPHVAWQLEVDLGQQTRGEGGMSPLLGMLRATFNRFIDLRADATGARSRPMSELGEALAYLEALPKHPKTDLIVFHQVPISASASQSPR